MKIFLIAGEASGDLHGAILSQALLKEDPSLQLVGFSDWICVAPYRVFSL